VKWFVISLAIFWMLGMVGVFGTCAYLFWTCVTYFSKTMVIGTPCRDIAPHDSVVGGLLGTITVFAFFVFSMKCYLDITKDR